MVVPQTATQTAKESPQKTQATQAAAQTPRPIEVTDIASWKRVQQPIVSNDGAWFAYRLSPNEGDGEVIVRRLSDNKELKFPAGESAGFAPLSFSEDSRWLAFTTYPTAKETRRLRKDRKPILTKVMLINLATEKKTEFEKVRRVAFAGERGDWVALHRSGDSPAPSMPGPAMGAPGAVGAQSDKAAGTDLILYELIDRQPAQHRQRV